VTDWLCAVVLGAGAFPGGITSQLYRFFVHCLTISDVHDEERSFLPGLRSSSSAQGIAA
jgi:hypothetical protein